MDITILSSAESEDATLWANYLSSCFQEIPKEENRPPFKLARVMVENVLMGLPVEGSSGSRLQIVIICPKFLRVLSTSQGVPILATMLQPATVLAMLLGVTAQALEMHQYAGLFRFDQWRKMTVKDKDKTFVGDFLGVAMDVLSRSWQLQQAIQQIKCDTTRSHFSIIPKKVKITQNKVLVLLNDPLCNADKINITIEKTGQKIEITSIKRRNPYTLQFTMPSVCLQMSQLVAINVERNGRSIGHRLVKCECRLREMDQLLKSADNPLAFMCQALGINGGDRDQLDSFLVASLQRNIPPNFNLLNAAMTSNCTSREEYPTLLHFAARFGLEKLCWQLLECPGGEAACQIRNGNQLGPAELAEKAGHTSLAQALNSYLQMTELSSMYTYMNAYLKNTTEKPQDFGEGNYLLPRPLSDTYLVPPKARPVTPTGEPPSPRSPFPPTSLNLSHPITNQKTPPSPLVLDPLENYQSPPSARPFTPMTPSTPNTPTDHFSAYLQMHSPMSDTSSTNFEHILSPEKKYSSFPGSDSASLSSSGSHHYMNTGRCGSSACGSSISSKMSPDDELAEIINDFKNNVYTISELEKLVEAWKNRNDVQQSFRDKKEQINKMRQEYERIQLKMKEQLKRPTPLDRIKKFFSRKFKHEAGNKEKGTTDSVSQRPVSSLSLHSSCSSSSSGRMSTTSGVSLGDSGTHSDPEEKKTEIAIEKVSPSPAFYERLRRQESAPDEYVTASYSEKCNLPHPPAVTRTVVDVHRSDILEESQEENSDQTVKTVEELVERFESLQNMDDSNYINPDLVETEQKIKTDSNETRKDKSEIEILEESDKILKSMANGLPNKDYIDILSPPESAFINGDDEVVPEGTFERKSNLNNHISSEVTKEALTKDDDDSCFEKIEQSDQSKLEENFIDTALTKDTIVLNEEKLVNNVFNNNIHEYMNVSSYLPPPIPPRCKYKNVLL
ncbi:phosphoinositide 3-kinase adapter protein 1 isoform X3 [Halyomorpha halys]|nr:uncharacterized protein LOC106690028 isoform X2 [Halyomorpha halys]